MFAEANLLIIYSSKIKSTPSGKQQLELLKIKQ